MTLAVLLPNGKQQFLDSNGSPLAGGSVYFYIPNTTTFKNTWQDSGMQTLNTNPVLLDSAGEAIIYGVGQYRQVVKDALGNTIWDQLTTGYPTYLGPQATLSSASTTDLGSVSVYVIQITGSASINSFGSSADLTSPIYFLTFTGTATLVYNATSLILPGGRNITTTSGANCIAQHLGSGNWQVISYTPANSGPTVRVLTTGSGTYTTPTGATTLRIRMVGGGGGGGSNGVGGNGGDTTFGTLSAGGGTGGSVSVLGGTGGSPTGGDINITGGTGGSGVSSINGSLVGTGGNGASSPFGGAGIGGPGTSAPTGENASANSGSGGGGGGAPVSGTSTSSGGGGAGGYLEKLITSPSATYSYAVGAGGIAGGGSGANQPGGTGGSGIIIIEETYS